MEKFYCSAKEFYFNREFSNFISAGEGKLNDELEGIQEKNSGRAYTIVLSGITSLVVLFIIPRLPVFTLQSTLKNGLIVILLVLIVSFYVQLYTGRKEYARYRDGNFNVPTSLQEQVLYYVVSEKGLYINNFNRKDINEMTLLLWENIEKAELDYLHVPYVRGGTQSKAKDVFQDHIKSIQKEHKGFDIEAKEKYEDRFALRFYYTMGRASHGSIAIPKEWRETGDEELFLEEIEKYVPVSKSAL